MENKVFEIIQKEKLITKGSHVIVGLSGGADSVCLLLLLVDLQKKMDFSLSAVHVEHGIRGEESREDARFAEKLCENLGISCRIFYVNVPAFAKEQRLGLEEAARIRRYACYREEAERIQNGRKANEPLPICVALAHHGNDNAETILFQMARGSGLAGLCGMKQKRPLWDGAEVMLIRPLLTVSRSEIEAYLCARGQTYCTDATNSDVNYSRNRLRHQVIPELEKINSQAAAHISRSGIRFNEIRDYLMREVNAARQKYGIQNKFPDGGKEVVILQEAFEKLPELLTGELIRSILSELSGGGKDVGSVHVDAVRDLILKQPGRCLSLPGNLRAERVYEGICIYQEKEQQENASGVLCEITLEELAATENGAAIEIPLGYFYDMAEKAAHVESDKKLKLKIYSAKELLNACEEVDFQGKMHKIGKKPYTKWLNYDIMKRSLLVRKRKSGDYLTVDLFGHNKKIKAYFIDEKVPRQMRENVWLLAEDTCVAWVLGGRMSEKYRVTKETKHILEVQIVGGIENED
jgi:tRNA(Ile)-lysidine synthase